MKFHIIYLIPMKKNKFNITVCFTNTDCPDDIDAFVSYVEFVYYSEANWPSLSVILNLIKSNLYYPDNITSINISKV